MVFYPVEITFGILGACLPILRPILHRKEYASRGSGQSFAMGQVPICGSRTELTREESRCTLPSESLTKGSARSYSRDTGGVVHRTESVSPVGLSDV